MFPPWERRFLRDAGGRGVQGRWGRDEKRSLEVGSGRDSTPRRLRWWRGPSVPVSSRLTASRMPLSHSAGCLFLPFQPFTRKPVSNSSSCSFVCHDVFSPQFVLSLPWYLARGRQPPGGALQIGPRGQKTKVTSGRCV